MTEARKILNELIKAGDDLANKYPDDRMYEEYIQESKEHKAWSEAYEKARDFLLSTPQD